LGLISLESRGEFENELGWWSDWATPIEFDRDTYGFISEDFREPLFNRVVFLEPPTDPDRSISKGIQRFGGGGPVPSFFVPQDDSFESVRNRLVGRGYRVADRFIVMSLEKPGLLTGRLGRSHRIRKSEVETWSKVYLESFYGEESLLKVVSRRVGKAREKRSNWLILAEEDGKAAGTVALHLTKGLLGLYCLGTAPSMRGRGIAGGLLSVARRLAEEKGTKLILQVFEEEGVEGFYLERGFSRVSIVDVFEK
jgi:N-acetylglutamate synthase-like GNAT family acetyltransferase